MYMIEMYIITVSRSVIFLSSSPLLGTLISFESLEYAVPENGGPVEVCLMKSAPTAQGFTVQLEARQTQPTEAAGKKWNSI